MKLVVLLVQTGLLGLKEDSPFGPFGHYGLGYFMNNINYANTYHNLNVTKIISIYNQKYLPYYLDPFFSVVLLFCNL